MIEADAAEHAASLALSDLRAVSLVLRRLHAQAASVVRSRSTLAALALDVID
jgi:hypothetical protein